MSDLQPGDRDNLWYHYSKSGDIAHCALYKLAQEIWQKEYPELIFAVKNLETAKRLLEAVMLRIRDDEEPED